jgi:hypothetical protein
MSQMKTKDERHYSGDASKRFWRRVNRLPWAQYGETAYVLGLMLQEFENSVMQYLENTELRLQKSRSPQRKARPR